MELVTAILALGLYLGGVWASSSAVGDLGAALTRYFLSRY